MIIQTLFESMLLFLQKRDKLKENAKCSLMLDTQQLSHSTTSLLSFITCDFFHVICIKLITIDLCLQILSHMMTAVEC